MATFGDRKLIASYEELPKINGRRITSIYGKMETAYYEKGRILGDAYGEKPDYYLLVTEDRDYRNGKWYDLPDIKTRELPKEIAQLFGPQNINGQKAYITRMWLRIRDSGHGGFIDGLCYLEGGCGAQSSSIVYYRTKRWKNAKGNVFEGEEYAKKINSILGKPFTVEELPEWFDREYPCSYVRRVGGLNYPDLKLDSWRWSHGHPYVSNKYNDHGYPDTTNIRVFYEPYNAHLYLERVFEPKEGEEDLIDVTFSRHHDKKPHQFCNIGSWADTKEGAAKGEIIRWKVLNISKNTEQGWPFKVAAMLNDKVQFTRQGWGDCYYRINRISYI